MELLALPSPYFDYIYVLSICLLTAYCSLFRPTPIINVTPFALALTTFYITIGTKWSAEKLVPIIFIVGYSLRTIVLKKYDPEISIKKIFLPALLLICASTIFGLMYLPEGDLITTGMQSPGIRSIIRGVSYIFSLLYFIIPLLFLDKLSDRLSPLKFYIYAGSILAVYAIYQNFAFRFGLPYRGIKYWEDTFGYGALETMGGLFRANGLANEPKQLSMYCITAAVCSFVLGSYLIKDSNKFKSFTLLNFIGFVLAYSGSGIFAFVLFVITFIFSPFNQIKSYIYVNLTKKLIIFISVLIILFASGKLSTIHKFADTLIFERADFSFNVDKIEGGKRVDYYVMSLLTSAPSHIITGFGMGNHPFWVFDKYKVGMDRDKGLEAADSGWLNLLADFGIISIAIFIAILTSVIKSYFSITGCNMSIQTRAGLDASFYCIMLSVFLMFFVAAFNLMLFWLGIFYAFKNIHIIESNNPALLARQ